MNIHADGARATIRSTRILGDERMGSGAVVDAAGLILTVNYVVMGARPSRSPAARAGALKAEVVAQDFEIGLALLRVKRQGLHGRHARRPDDARARRARRRDRLHRPPRAPAWRGGLVTYLGEFEAYWEYLLDRGIVSSATNPGFGGGGLFTLSGR